MTEHTPTPWLYRPHEHDDWGWIRARPHDGETIGPLVAITRSAKRETSDRWEEHRRNGTDPFQANADFIIKAVNNHEALVKSLREARAALIAFKDAVEASQKLNGREYIGLGIQINDAIGRAYDVLGDVGGSRDD